MRLLTKKVIVSAIVSGCAWWPQLAHTQTTTALKKPTSTISGRVTVDGKGRSGIVVGVHPRDFDPTHAPPRKAETDADGVYRIREVPAGNYFAAPMSTAFVFADSSLMNFQGKGLILSEGENIEGVDFALIRGAVITGKVTDEEGEPVIEQQVEAIPFDQPNQGRFPVTPISFQTDDRGIYRIFGLRPGRYRVAVGQSASERLSEFNRRTRYQRIYYPDATEANVERAKVIELAEGDQVSNIDITLAHALPGFAVSGSIQTAETNQPVANVRLFVQKVMGDGDSYVPITGVSNQKGEFRVENLSPGNYSISIYSSRETNLRADSVRFQITDQDVSGLVLKAARGATVTGYVVVEGSKDPAVLDQLRGMRVYAWVRGGPPGGSSEPSPIATDGSFKLTSLAQGLAYFQLLSTDYPRQAKFMMTRIERDGIVIPRDAFEIKPEEEISGVKFVVTYGDGSVRGTINFEKGPPVAGVRIFLRLNKVGDSSNSLFGGEPDLRGKFLIENVPPGTYDLTVEMFNPTAPRSRPVVLATRSVTVTQNAATEVIISVDATTAP